jgi:hypothetical protein
MLPLIAAMAAGGAASGFLGSKKTAGQDTGNNFNVSYDDLQKINGNLKDVLNYKGSEAATDPLQSSRIATQEVMNNPMLSQLFGKGGALERANSEEQSLASRGYSLQPEDHEAYGQASGDIARMFGQQEQSLAQALASRGQSSAGAAGRSFAGLQGNKMEQLAGLQRKIADDRMNMNMQRLGQTRNFLSQMGNQGQQAIQQQYGRQADSEDRNFGQMVSKVNAGESRLRDQAGQSNENLSQRMATQEVPGWAKAGMGFASGGTQGILAGLTGPAASATYSAGKKA